jgi:cell wall-associated NlpC family hydrolase
MGILGSRHIRRVSRGQLRRGDLVWPSGGHIAIYLGHGRIVHAANRREGVRIAPLYGFLAGGRIVA